MHLSAPLIARRALSIDRWALGTWLGVIGATLLAALVIVAVCAPLLTGYDPQAQVAAPFAAPSATHPLGANDIGQDLLAELLFGTRVSLLIGIAAALVATVIGTAVGLASGFLRGAVDSILMRSVDVMIAFPALPLMIVVAAFLGPGIATEIAVIAAIGWAHGARELRSQVLSTRERGNIVAAQAMGAGGVYVLRRHLLTAVFPLVITHFVRAVSVAILLEASLSFLGLGDPTTKSWGTMLFYANARSAFLTGAWVWWVMPAGLGIVLTVLSFALVGFALEERMRPRLRAIGTPARRHRTARPTLPIVRSDVGDEPILRVDELTVAYVSAAGSVRAVNGVSLVVRRGEVLGVVGESGSGKTTLAAALLRLVKPPGSVVGGQILLDGDDLAVLSVGELRRVRGGRIGLIPQNAMNALDPVMTVADQIAEAITVHRKVGRRAALARARELLELVRLPAERGGAYPHELSGGMRQRVAIAMALANDPPLLIADEPTSGLDLLVQAEILSLLGELRSRLGLAMLFISHDLPVVLKIADRLAVMWRGEIVEEGPVATVAADPRHPYTRRLLGSVPRLARDARPVVARENGPTVLRLSDVCRSFAARGAGSRRIPVLDGVSFSIDDDELVGLVGGSGVGKSTVARLILGLIPPDSGRIEFEAQDVTRVPGARRRAARRRMHLVFQDPYDALPPGMRVDQIVAEPLAIQGVGRRDDRRARVLGMLAEVGLEPPERFARRYTHELSGGERQRVALARALILKPRLIVADEPTSMLDVSLRTELIALMRRLHDRHGTAYLYITHDLALASGFCDRLLVLHQGRVVEEGPTHEVLGRPRHPYTVSLVRAVEDLAPQRRPAPPAQPVAERLPAATHA